MGASGRPMSPKISRMAETAPVSERSRSEIRPDTRAILEGALLNPSIDTVTHLREHMKTELRYAGVPEVDDLLRAFFATFLPERREAVYRDSYL